MRCNFSGRNVLVLTTITLDHTLRITGRPNRQWSSPPIQSDPEVVFSDIGELSPRDFLSDGDSDVQIHLINFNPHPPDNPKKMYANNPFFSRMTTTSTVRPIDIRNGFDANPFLNNVRPNLEGDAGISGTPFLFNGMRLQPIVGNAIFVLHFFFRWEAAA